MIKGMTVIGVVLDLPASGQVHFQDVVPGQMSVARIFVRSLAEIIRQLSYDGDDQLSYCIFSISGNA